RHATSSAYNAVHLVGVRTPLLLYSRPDHLGCSTAHNLSAAGNVNGCRGWRLTLEARVCPVDWVSDDCCVASTFFRHRCGSCILFPGEAKTRCSFGHAV